MVATIKFSQFAAVNLTNTANKIVGVSALSAGNNFYSDYPLTWATINRPVMPSVGTLGYNTNLGQYEYWNGVIWIQLAAGGSGSVNSGTINQLAFYATSGNAVSGFMNSANSVLITTAGSVPQWSTVLPSGITGYTIPNLSDVAWSTWTPTYTGFSGTPTTNMAFYKKIGKTVFVNLDMTGTSNATGFAFSLPLTAGANGITFAVGRAVDNGAYSASVYGAVGSGGAVNGAFVINDSGLGWTTSGTKGVRCSFFYEVP